MGDDTCAGSCNTQPTDVSDLPVKWHMSFILWLY